MYQLEDALLIHPKIDEVDKFQTANSELIEEIEAVDKEVVQSFIVDPVCVALCIDTSMNNLKRDSIELIDDLIEVEH